MLGSRLGAHEFHQLVRQQAAQIHVAFSHDPYLNLATEKYLLQHTPPRSTILFLYVNAISVVIGRNQNPWHETNLAQLRQRGTTSGIHIPVIRRCTGGGTVVHDLGNINYSVITDSAGFTQDRHAQVVTRAIRAFNARARVNERHDIVLDMGPKLSLSDPDITKNMYTSGFERDMIPSRKVSGSAYKITKGRAMHHGTLLMQSPELGNFSSFLTSPAQPYMHARGVDSVRSPVTNIFNYSTSADISGILSATREKLMRKIISAFAEEHDLRANVADLSFAPHDRESTYLISASTGSLQTPQSEATPRVTHPSWNIHQLSIKDVMQLSDVMLGVDEMKSPKWAFAQTPEFELSTHPTPKDPRTRPNLAPWFPPSGNIFLKIKSATIIEVEISCAEEPKQADKDRSYIRDTLLNREIYKIRSFENLLSHAQQKDRAVQYAALGRWIDIMLGNS